MPYLDRVFENKDEVVTIPNTLKLESGKLKINNVVISSLVTSSEIVTATNVILASESGTTYFLNSTTEFASTLPVPAIGLRYTFIVTAAPSGASYTIGTNAGAAIIKGHVLPADGNAGDTETTGAATITIANGQAVAGDRVEIISDGTNWFFKGTCKVAAGITIA